MVRKEAVLKKGKKREMFIRATFEMKNWPNMIFES